MSDVENAAEAWVAENSNCRHQKDGKFFFDPMSHHQCEEKRAFLAGIEYFRAKLEKEVR